MIYGYIYIGCYVWHVVAITCHNQLVDTSWRYKSDNGQSIRDQLVCQQTMADEMGDIAMMFSNVHQLGI